MNSQIVHYFHAIICYHHGHSLNKSRKGALEEVRKGGALEEVEENGVWPQVGCFVYMVSCFSSGVAYV